MDEINECNIKPTKSLQPIVDVLTFTFWLRPFWELVVQGSFALQEAGAGRGSLKTSPLCHFPPALLHPTHLLWADKTQTGELPGDSCSVCLRWV